MEYIIDWCFFYDKRKIPNRHLFLEHKAYNKPGWFFGNDEGFYLG